LYEGERSICLGSCIQYVPASCPMFSPDI
jgi:hypothetical protein